MQKVPTTSDSQWCSVLADYIRMNDKAVLEVCDQVLSQFEDELLPCESFDEFLDVVGESVGLLKRDVQVVMEKTCNR